MNDEWYYDDECPYLDESVDYLNTIWEECTADLISKSTDVDEFTSFRSNNTDEFTSFRSEFTSSNSARYLFEQDSECGLCFDASARLSVHGEETEEEEEGEEKSSSSINADIIVHQESCLSTDEAEKEAIRIQLDNANISDETKLEAEYVSASPRTSLCKSSSDTIEPPFVSPRSPLEMLRVEQAMMENGYLRDSKAGDNISSDVAYDYSSMSYSRSKRVDFSGTVVKYDISPRELKRERIRAKMQAIEEKVVQAKVILNIHTIASSD